jgi:putative ABC transport system permease protein
MSARSLFDATAADVRHALRSLARSPVYTATAIATLAIGIGATTAAYSVAGSILLKPLPFADPDRLVAVWSSVPQFDKIAPSYPDFVDFRAQSDVFDGIAYMGGDGVRLRRQDGAIKMGAAMVTEDYFPLLRATPRLGRTFVASDNVPGAAPVAVMSYSVWAQHFGSDPKVIGQTLDLNIGSYTVVGVLSPGQAYPEWVPGFHTDLYIPLASAAYRQGDLVKRGNHADTRTIARLKPGVTLAQARDRLTLVAHRLAAAYPATDSGFSANVTLLQDQEVGDVRPALAVLVGAVVLVFLLACADVANLSLVRATARARELGVRAALGAAHGRIIRYLLIESALLAIAGSVLGVLLATIGVRALIAASPGDIPRMDEITINGPALMITLGAAMVATLLCGLAPLAGIRRADLIPVLKAGGRGASGGHGSGRLRTGIVAAQMAMAMILIVGAGLLIRSYVKLRHVDPGFDPSHLVMWSIGAPKNADSVERWQLYQRALAAATVPGVVSISMVNHGPLTGGVGTGVGVEGKDPTTDSVGVTYTTIAPHYFETARIPLLRGREFTDADMTPNAAVAIVSQSMVKRYWPPNTDPVGRQMVILNGSPHDPDYQKPIPVTVVGVVGDVRHTMKEDKPDPQVYLPYTRPVWGFVTLIARTAGPPQDLVPTLRRAVLPIDPDISLDDLGTGERIVALDTTRDRFTTSLLSAFSLVALVLAVLGLYGVISYAVSQRVPEIGIRMALGAKSGDIVRLVIQNAFLVVAIGLSIGIFGAALLGHAMRSLLFGVGEFDPVTVMSVAVLLTAVALIASYLPARRASRVNPLTALRID